MTSKNWPFWRGREGQKFFFWASGFRRPAWRHKWAEETFLSFLFQSRPPAPSPTLWSSLLSSDRLLKPKSHTAQTFFLFEHCARRKFEFVLSNFFKPLYRTLPTQLSFVYALIFSNLTVFCLVEAFVWAQEDAGWNHLLGLNTCTINYRCAQQCVV